MYKNLTWNKIFLFASLFHVALAEGESIDAFLAGGNSSPCIKVSNLNSDGCARNDDLSAMASECASAINNKVALASKLMSIDFSNLNKKDIDENIAQKNAAFDYAKAQAAMKLLISMGEAALEDLHSYHQNLFIPDSSSPNSNDLSDLKGNSCFWDSKTQIEAAGKEVATNISQLKATAQVAFSKASSSISNSGKMNSLNSGVVKNSPAAKQDDQTGQNRGDADISGTEDLKKSK